MRLTEPKRRAVRNATRGALRLWQAWIVTMLLAAAVYAVAPQQVALVAYKGLFITLGAIAGYWVDHWSFPPIRSEPGHERVHGMYRRAALMAAAMLAFGLGA